MLAAVHPDHRQLDELPHGQMRRLSPAFYQGHAFVHWNMTMQDRRTGWLTPAFHLRFREIQLHTLSRYQLLCLCYCLMPDHLHLLWAGLSEASDQDKAAAFFRKQFNRLLAEASGTAAGEGNWSGSASRAAVAGAGSGSAPMGAGAARLPEPGAERLSVPGKAAGAGSGSAPMGEGAERLMNGAARLPEPGMLSLQKQAWDVVLREHDRERGALERELFYITENPVRACLVADASDWAYSGSQAAGYPNFDWRDKDFTERLWTIYEMEIRKYGAERLPVQEIRG